MFEELDVVTLLVPLLAEGLPAGASGTVVAVWGDHEAYEIEFVEGERTLALATVPPDSLALAHRYIPTASVTAAD